MAWPPRPEHCGESRAPVRRAPPPRELGSRGGVSKLPSFFVCSEYFCWVLCFPPGGRQFSSCLNGLPTNLKRRVLPSGTQSKGAPENSATKLIPLMQHFSLKKSKLMQKIHSGRKYQKLNRTSPVLSPDVHFDLVSRPPCSKPPWCSVRCSPPGRFHDVFWSLASVSRRPHG